MTQRTKVCVKSVPSKAQVQHALAEDWFTVSNRHGKGVMVQLMEEPDASTINRAITKDNLPSLHKALASLLVDPTALNSTLALYGGRFVPTHSDAANDFSTIADLSHLVTAFVRVLEDGVRDHVETLELAALIGPLVAKLGTLMEEARRIKGVAA